VKRHSDDELNRIQRAAQFAPHSGEIAPKTAGIVLLVFLYAAGIAVVLAAVLGAASQNVPLPDLPFEWLIQMNQMESFGMILFGVLCAGALLLGASAAWLALARPLSRHHAGFMTIIAVLVLVFGTLYFFPALHGA
jgi:hypothetical protein